MSRQGNTAALARMDSLAQTLEYIPITTSAMRLAADLWGQTRNAGIPTADALALDGDVILVAQVRTLQPALISPIVANTNVNHIARLIAADLWENILP